MYSRSGHKEDGGLKATKKERRITKKALEEIIYADGAFWVAAAKWQSLETPKSL